MARLQLDNLRKTYGDTVAVDRLSLDVAEGEFVVLLGPSGCGKTTSLRMVAGFVPASEGRIRLGGRDITELPPYRRNCGLVFQNYALFPHLSVYDNVAFGLRMRRLPESEVKARAGEALSLVRLEGFDARMPRQLSGGQQQRVALARALAIHPDVLLLDEPLSNLDAKLRQEVRGEIRALQRRLGLTTLLVTHDQEEALALADRLVVMAEGRLQQVGTQRQLYEQPANRFVAGFIGRMNFLALPDGRTLAVRPEKVALGAGGRPGKVENSAYLGAYTEVQVRLASGELVTAHAQLADGLPAGTEVTVDWPEAAALIM